MQLCVFGSSFYHAVTVWHVCSVTHVVIGSLLSWSQAMVGNNTVSTKRSHDHSGASHEPPEKKVKTDQCEDQMSSSTVLMEGEEEERITVDDREVTSTSSLRNNNDIDKEPAKTTDSESLADCLSLVAKLMEFCNQSATLDIKEVEQLWEELSSASANQVWGIYGGACYHPWS